MKLPSRHWYVFSLVVIVIISQIILLEPHLKYGFSDVDWGFLSFYKTQNPYTIHQFIKNIEVGGTMGGVYTHQIYYIGIQNDLFGLDFKSFQITTHIFKILATLAVFPLLLAISGSILIALIATILFAFSYSSVGTMYTVVTSSDYSAILFMGIFVVVYWYMVKKNIGNWSLQFLLFFLLILTLFLSTERMYQLPLFIFMTEMFLFWQRKKLEKNAIKRLLIMFVPLSLIFFAKPMIFLSYFTSHGIEIVQGVFKGNWNLLLTPFIALGSIIGLPAYTKFLGVPKIDNFGNFLEYIISGPLFILITLTLCISLLVFKKFYTFFQILVLILFSLVLLYVLGNHFADHQISIGSINLALIGFYVMILSIVSFIQWLKYKNRLLIGLFVGPFFAFGYIFLTWLGAATSEVFSGSHRYLTIPALFMSLFLSSLFVIIFTNLYKFVNNRFFGFMTLAIFIPLLFFIFLNVQEIKAFFNFQLASGFGVEDKKKMRDQLIQLTPNLSNNSPSLFYFDFSEDQERGYYYDNTLTGGFNTWMLWHPGINLNKRLAPKVFWNDPKKLKSAYLSKDGVWGFNFENEFFELENFYALRLKDKIIYDIKAEILQNLESF
ncbi:MAG: hypothetical protein AAB414_02510 [Patescibacteria group bacterium]